MAIQLYYCICKNPRMIEFTLVTLGQSFYEKLRPNPTKIATVIYVGFGSKINDSTTPYTYKKIISRNYLMPINC